MYGYGPNGSMPTFPPRNNRSPVDWTSQVCRQFQRGVDLLGLRFWGFLFSSHLKSSSTIWSSLPSCFLLLDISHTWTLLPVRHYNVTTHSSLSCDSVASTSSYFRLSNHLMLLLLKTSYATENSLDYLLLQLSLKFLSRRSVALSIPMITSSTTLFKRPNR